MKASEVGKYIGGLLREGKYTQESDSVRRLATMPVDFVFVEVNCPDLATAPQLLERVIDFLKTDKDLFIGELLSTFVLAYFGMPRPVQDGPEKRKRCAERLMQEFGKGVRIVHGTTNAAVGNFGGSIGLHYGALSLQTADQLKALISCEYGQVRELI